MPEQQLYLARLMGYDYSIQYHSGKHNVAADALSRIPATPIGKLLMIIVPHLVFLQELKTELQLHPDYVAFRQSIEADPQNYPNCVILHDLII